MFNRKTGPDRALHWLDNYNGDWARGSGANSAAFETSAL